jgi:hypothetical protein
MSFTSLQVDDQGTIIRTTLRNQDDDPINLTGHTSLVFRFQKPDSSVVEKVALVQGDDADGTVYYVTEEAFLDQAGTWLFQVFVETPAGAWHSDTSSFQVKENFA